MTTTTPTDAIPDVLKTGTRFVAWRYERRKDRPKPAKMPYSPIMERPQDGASSTNPAHWTTFEKARAYATVAGLDGVMRAFDHADRIVGVDLDTCRNPETGELTPEAAERIKRADTYTEVSPSRTGVKMWMYATMPAFGHKKGDVEIYGSVAGQTGPCGRFFTMTGQHVEGTPREVCYRPDFVLALHREIFGDAPDPATVAADPDRPVPALQLGDEDVIRLAAESAHNGARFRRLWGGDTSDYAIDGNDGASEADAALCELLAYYGGPDRERVERLWLRSGLGAREKLERADYRKRTIDLALTGKSRFYGDSIRPPVPTGGDGAETSVAALRARVAYLERALLDRDDLDEDRQAVIRAQRARLDVLEPLVAYMDEVISRPEHTVVLDDDGTVVEKTKDGPTTDDKLVAIAVARWLPSYRARKDANGEDATVSLGYLEKVMGMPRARISKSLHRQESDDPKSGAPWRTVTTRRPVFAGDGPPIIDPRTGRQKFESSLEVIPYGDTRAMLRASATYILPALPQHGGSLEASDTRWGRCARHPRAMIDLEGRCVVDRELLGRRRVSPETFERLNLQLGDPEREPAPPVSVGIPIDDDLGDSDIPARADEPLNVRVVDPGPARTPAPGGRLAWWCTRPAVAGGSE